MSRLIDADALIDKAKEYGGYYEDTVYAVPLADISDAPTVDAVEVVRCEECKHNVGLSNGDGFWEEDIVCDYWESDGLKADDYCSYGEREGE